MRRAWRFLRRYRVSITTVALTLAVVVLFARSEQERHDLRSEARARTLESCRNSADGRHATRATFLAIFDLFDTQAALVGQPRPPAVQPLREIVERELPELTCPTDQGVIVIPLPSSTTVPPPPPSADLTESTT